MRNVFLSNDKISLRCFESDDVSLITKWLNDADVTRFMFYGQKPMTEEQVGELINSQLGSDKNVVLMIDSCESPSAIGFCGLYDIHPTARKAEFRILIGDKNCWGRGYGTEVTKLLTAYGFDRLNLHKIWLGFTSENISAGKAYKKSGYTEEGILRDDIYRNGRYYDTVRMSILREEFYRGKTSFTP
ncbi:MAG: GNAT family N-acetyltransferase [Candidatus Harrisonbacteria bacterium CG10_big_fil_rev_8_21_14_0_10_40_38]|uniref:GNAT family N-acetyltransferase n=1 Tax=Candidatus Harrisonbacteria bacterium CG10_big_fil_rev_8_21_14_0_10_40_38 TaxID=1974583 RepID=A0A2H0URK0_9BACT|nr:MAG: GNAT family N-acetyltransferase [Candidatus Harrisonbacteria bacterium CG10_big_fil_rev_8_21_14_0_10_40_38]